MIGPLLPVPRYEPHDLRAQTVVLTEDFIFPLRLAGPRWKNRKERFIARKGFESDGGSIPRLAWTLCNVTPFTPSWIAEFVTHDGVYAGHLLPRTEGDLLLRDMGYAYGNTAYGCEMIYWHVWGWGWTVYNDKNHSPAKIEAARRYVELLPA